MRQKLLRDLIEENIHLGRESSTGFRTLRCQVCNDHSERAGFKFDGDTIGYSCFNCGTKFRYEENSGKLGKHARRVLEAFGITRQQLDEIVGAAFFKKADEPKTITMEALKGPAIKLFTPEVDLPPRSHPLGVVHHDGLQAPLIEYLLGRKLDPIALNAHFSLDPKFLNRVILPCTRDGKVIFWQARTILDGVKPRYLSPGTDKTAVLYGYHRLWRDYDLPLFVTEGIFDAESIEGVALLGSKLNDSKIEVLNRCRRRKIVVVDRDENGKQLADLALQTGWEVTFPPADDANKSVMLYGKAFTIWSLLSKATVPGKLVTSDGISVQSSLQLQMEMALARRKRK